MDELSDSIWFSEQTLGATGVGPPFLIHTPGSLAGFRTLTASRGRIRVWHDGRFPLESPTPLQPERAVSHETFLRRAIQLAETHSADGRNGPFGSVVVKDGEVVGEGWNQVVENSDPTAHAEVMAIRDAGKLLGAHDLTGCTIYASCEPCPMCLSAIYWARIGTVVFSASAEDAAAAGFDDTRILEELGRGWVERSLEGTQALREDGRRVLKGWAENPRKTPY